MMTNKNNKTNYPFLLACILLCCVMISLHFVDGLHARYISKSEGSSFARVAIWKVDASSDETAMNIDCSTTDLIDEYAFTLTNESEVDVKYDIIVEFTNVLDSGIALNLDGTVNPTTEDNKTFVFSEAGNLSANATSKEHFLRFTATLEEIEADITCTFNVKVDFEQID